MTTTPVSCLSSSFTNSFSLLSITQPDSHTPKSNGRKSTLDESQQEQNLLSKELSTFPKERNSFDEAIISENPIITKEINGKLARLEVTKIETLADLLTKLPTPLQTICRDYASYLPIKSVKVNGYKVKAKFKIEKAYGKIKGRLNGDFVATPIPNKYRVTKIQFKAAARKAFKVFKEDLEARGFLTNKMCLKIDF